VSATDSGQRREHHDASRADRPDNREHGSSLSLLPTLVGLLPALTLNRLTPSFGPGVPRHAAGLAQALVFVAQYYLSAAETGRLATHEFNDATGRILGMGPTRTVVR
jgi:hypothetical protein